MLKSILKLNSIKSQKYITNKSKLIERQIKLSQNCSHFCDQRVDSNETHFGFKSVSNEEKAKKVNEVFTSVAEKYDLMNDVMSFGIHRHWKRFLIQTLDPLRGTVLLDACGGTGDIATQFVRHMRHRYPNDSHFRAVVCDINEDMLKVGQNKVKQMSGSVDNRIDWVLGDAMSLPFEDNSFDAFTVGFGIRNVVDIDKALSEAHRVLKSGGVFLCLEFSQMRNPLIGGLYDWYSFQIIPVFGEIFAKDWKSYQYLVESIRRFPDKYDFKDMIESKGFTLCQITNLLDGIACIHSGYKK